MLSDYSETKSLFLVIRIIAMKTITRKPLFWVSLSLLSLACIAFSIKFFSTAFPIVNLDLKMNRPQALAYAATLAERFHLGPTPHTQASSFETDTQVQTFVELEAGGKEAFTAMLKEKYYSPYTWHIRHFKEFDKNEVTIIFKPDGRGRAQVVDKVAIEDWPGAGVHR